MLKPEYLANAPEALVELYSQVEQDILADMAERIAKYDYYIPAVQHQHQKLRAMGMLQGDIQNELGKLLGKSGAEVRAIMQNAIDTALSEDAKIYAKSGMLLNFDPAEIDSVKTILKAGLQQTNGLFRNLTRTTANTAAKQFEDALDRAWLQITSGAFDYNTAVKNAVKDLSKQGVQAITYPTGHTDTLETAVRRAVVTGINQTAAKSQLALMDELDIDLVEVTAHSGARPSHAEWQGQIFCRRGKHPKYKDFVKSTGYGTGDGLCGWNCNHSFYPYVEGAPRTYTKEMLNDYTAKKYEYNGKKLTEYEATQQQRYIERQIRRWKREGKAMTAAGQSADEANSKVAAWQSRQRDFIKQTGLKRDYSREQIGKGAASSGFTKSAKQDIISVKKAIGYNDRAEAEKVLSANAKNWTLTPEETYSVKWYTDDGFRELNAWLRGRLPDDDYSDLAARLDGSLSRFMLTEDLSVIRGMGEHTLRRYGLTLDDSIIGKSFSDLGFMSTSIDFDKAKEFAMRQRSDPVLLQFDIPAGKGRGAYINDVSIYPDEYEFLVKRSAEFEFYEITKKDGITLLKARWKK